MSDEALA